MDTHNPSRYQEAVVWLLVGIICVLGYWAVAVPREKESKCGERWEPGYQECINYYRDLEFQQELTPEM